MEFWDRVKQALMEIKIASIFTFVGSPFFFLSGFTLIPRGFLLFRKKDKPANDIYMFKPWSNDNASHRKILACACLCLVWLPTCDGLWWLATNLSLFKFHRKFLSTCEDLRVVWTRNTSRWKSLVSKLNMAASDKVDVLLKQRTLTANAAKPNRQGQGRM